MYFETLWHEFANLPEVTAIALGGSRAGENYDEKSDYDLYLYCTKLPSETVRREILERTCSYMEIGNAFWELEDDCTLKDGIDIDILYRDMESFQESLSFVVEKGNACNGYTTCMWHNLLNSKILYDAEGKLSDMKKRFTVPYPAQLKANIIDRNWKLLHGYLPSYDGQVKKAALRNDFVAVNHRVAAFMESYFDIIFALNEMTHPGEKREVQLAKQNAHILPERFEENIEDLFKSLYVDTDKAMDILRDMIEKLKFLGI